MKIVSITDVHGEIFFTEQMEMSMRKSDLILLSGDITHFGNKNDARKVIESIKIYNRPILAVPGNCDKKNVARYLEEESINIHGRITDIDGIVITGIGFSEETSWNKYPSQFSKKYFQIIAEKIAVELPQDTDFILLSHAPPYNTKCDVIIDSDGQEIHAGNMIIRYFIEKTQPMACFCGHIHESIGTDIIGRTLIVNPGPAGNGNFAFLDLGQKPLRPIIIKGCSINHY